MLECSNCKGLTESCSICNGWAYQIKQQEEIELDKYGEPGIVLFFPGCAPEKPFNSAVEIPPSITPSPDLTLGHILLSIEGADCSTHDAYLKILSQIVTSVGKLSDPLELSNRKDNIVQLLLSTLKLSVVESCDIQTLVKEWLQK